MYRPEAGGHVVNNTNFPVSNNFATPEVDPDQPQNNEVRQRKVLRNFRNNMTE